MKIPNLFNNNEQSVSLANLLIVGNSGSGRFNFINRYLSDLVRAYSPEKLRIILVDPKNYLFSDYSDLPHLMFGIIGREDKFYKIVNYLNQEIDKRLNNESSEAGAIVLIIDEIADFIINSIEKRELLEKVFKKITTSSDKTNIHVIFSTTRIDKTILTNNFLQCFEWRVAFRVDNKEQSVLIINESGAEELSLPGTCILKDMETQKSNIIKIPFISDEEIKYNKLETVSDGNISK